MESREAAMTLAGMNDVKNMEDNEKESEQTACFGSGIKVFRESGKELPESPGQKENEFVRPNIPVSSTKKSDQPVAASEMEYSHLHDSLMCLEVLEPPSNMSASSNEDFMISHQPEDDSAPVTPRGKKHSIFSEPWSSPVLSSSMKKTPKSSVSGLQSPITKASVTFSMGDSREPGMIFSSAIKHSPLVRSTKHSSRTSEPKRPFVTPPPGQTRRHSPSSTLRRSTRSVKKPTATTSMKQEALMAKPRRISQSRNPNARSSTKKAAPTKKASPTKAPRRGKSITKGTMSSTSKGRAQKGPSRSTSKSRKAPVSTSYATNGRLTWSSLNDKKMVEIVTNLLGEKPIGRTLNVDWQAVARQLKTGRTSKQCRDRWMNHLRPGLKKGNWTKREAKEIITLHKKLGPKWSHMAVVMPNRSENDIKNKFYSMKRCAERAQQVMGSNLDAGLSDDEEVAEVEEASTDNEDFDATAITTSTGGKDLSLLLAAHHRINSQQESS